MNIRHDQMMTFEQNAAKSFEDRAVDYLVEHFPDKCNAIGSENLPELARLARARAAAQYIYGERGIMMYLHLMFVLGSFFDYDLMYPWAGQTLAGTVYAKEDQRLQALWAKAEEYRKKVMGENDEHLGRVLKTLHEEAGQWPPPFVGGTPEDYVIHRLKDLYPEKAAFVGQDRMKLLTQVGLKSARNYKLTNKSGISAFTTLMFMLGTYFDTDPQYKWAAEVLKDESLKEPSDKANRLFSEAVKYLDMFAAPEAATA